MADAMTLSEAVAAYDRARALRVQAEADSRAASEHAGELEAAAEKATEAEAEAWASLQTAHSAAFGKQVVTPSGGKKVTG